MMKLREVKEKLLEKQQQQHDCDSEIYYYILLVLTQMITKSKQWT